MTFGNPTHLQLRLDDLSDPRIAAFLEDHLADMRRVSPPESVHALDLEKLRQPDIRFWTMWEIDGITDNLLGTGALKKLDATHAEVKSMRTVTNRRQQGLGATMLQHLMAQARLAGHTRLSLETGSQDFFAPARALYQRHGFVVCEPFGDYQPDPNSAFYTRMLS